MPHVGCVPLSRARFRRDLLLGVLLGCAACHMPTPGFDPPDEFAAARRALLSELRAEGITRCARAGGVGSVCRGRNSYGRTTARYAYVNEALPIGGGQTISQPYIVALMSAAPGAPRRRARARGRHRLAAIRPPCSPRSRREVYSIEIDPALADTARERLQRPGLQQRAGALAATASTVGKKPRHSTPSSSPRPRRAFPSG